MSFNTGIVPLLPLMGKPISMCNTQLRISLEVYEKLAEKSSTRNNAVQALPVFKKMVEDFIQMLKLLKTELENQIVVDSGHSLNVFAAMKESPADHGVDPAEAPKIYAELFAKVQEGEDLANRGVDIIDLEISSTNSILVRCYALASKLGITL
jgi:hypothetical protein